MKIADAQRRIRMDDVATPQPSREQLPVNIGLSEEHRKQLSKGLQGVLADFYTLLGKTHGFHWNVVGLQFRSLHEMFEEQYRDLQNAVDEIAERIRALGFSRSWQSQPIPEAHDDQGRA
jgi:starvation-inducible DNA-binding protein